MAHIPDPDWDPRSPEVAADQIAAYDAMRSRQSVAYSPYGNWAVLTHADAVRVLDDPETFSNVVSSRTSVPNGMDPPEHTPFRAIVDRFFTPARMAEIEPRLRGIAAELVAALPRGGRRRGDGRAGRAVRQPRAVRVHGLARSVARTAAALDGREPRRDPGR